MRQLVIGYGNQLRGDDGLGCDVVNRLVDDLKRLAVDTIACHQLTPELVDPLRFVQRVIFVDAQEGDRPGQITVSRIWPLESGGVFTHNTTPQGLLQAVDAWYGVQPEGYLLTVTGADFSLREGLSPSVEQALPDVVSALYRLLEMPVSIAESN